MSPRKARTQELTRDIIVQKARSLFVEKGYQEVSMRSIAKELACSHGAIYYHFKNKAALFYAIVDEGFAVLNQLIEETLHGKEQDMKKLHKLMLRFIEFGLDNQSQYEMMFMQREREVDSLSREAANLSYEKFAKAIQALSANRLKLSGIWSVFLSLHGFVSHYHGVVGGFAEAKTAAEYHVQFLIQGLESHA
ncbi:TetR/AcrR family transcriptional regulator [Niallia sp. BSM11]|uniref:TetR/AcrR family transcriptional regulator n=1 Tax=Niallia sp. BSM11 TaxID=3391576 RepID=UPI0039846FD2